MEDWDEVDWEEQRYREILEQLGLPVPEYQHLIVEQI